MKAIDVRKSTKSKVVKGKVYLWEQAYMDVPKEYRDEEFLYVMTYKELIEILTNEKLREKILDEMQEDE